jgi:hypothetical protein
LPNPDAGPSDSAEFTNLNQTKISSLSFKVPEPDGQDDPDLWQGQIDRP